MEERVDYILDFVTLTDRVGISHLDIEKQLDTTSVVKVVVTKDPKIFLKSSTQVPFNVGCFRFHKSFFFFTYLDRRTTGRSINRVKEIYLRGRFHLDVSTDLFSNSLDQVTTQRSLDIYLSSHCFIGFCITGSCKVRESVNVLVPTTKRGV